MNTIPSGMFSKAIIAENALGFAAVIPDIKCKSPKEGDLLLGRNPVEIAKQLVCYGAPLISVVTEQKYFGGSHKLLSSITSAVNVPVLRKDFILNEYMLQETVALGATAVLLICSLFDETLIKTLYNKALGLGLEPLIEVHSAEEMKFAGTLGARLIGINNRSIKSLECDNGGAQNTASLAPYLPDGALLISESGILSPIDAKTSVSAGANALLVGTALWKANDMVLMYRSLRVGKGTNI